MPKEKNISVDLVPTSVLLANWFSNEFANRSARNAGIICSKILLKIKVAILKIVEKCKIFSEGEINPGESFISHTIFTEKKEEAYQSIVLTGKFMLQKW